jgi:hypothetical protein
MTEMDTRSHFRRLAAYNNAVWCDVVCRSHGVPGEFHESFWANRQQTPIYYPDLITLVPEVELTDQAIAEIIYKKRGHAVSVKDSFAVLDLASNGFFQLFQAQWIFRQAPRQKVPAIGWERVTTEQELARWEEAWSQPAPSASRLFLPVLLDDADISMMAVYAEGRIIAGASANRTISVVGLSNVFTPSVEAERYWEGFLGMIAARYPGLPIVGYARDESLARALSVGFTPLGALRVWIKE